MRQAGVKTKQVPPQDGLRSCGPHEASHTRAAGASATAAPRDPPLPGFSPLLAEPCELLLMNKICQRDGISLLRLGYKKSDFTSCSVFLIEFSVVDL